MSTAPDEPPFHRPRWIVPVAMLGVLLLVLGIVLALAG
jgi:hypothetical protein